jgi:hypothetical protein
MVSLKITGNVLVVNDGIVTLYVVLHTVLRMLTYAKSNYSIMLYVNIYCII